MDGRRRMNKDPLEKGQRRTEKGRHLLQRRGGGRGDCSQSLPSGRRLRHHKEPDDTTWRKRQHLLRPPTSRLLSPPRPGSRPLDAAPLPDPALPRPARRTASWRNGCWLWWKKALQRRHGDLTVGAGGRDPDTQSV